ncbi:MAG TPA: DinB family protein [Acidimicrobiales bacterium]|nr:DinB family protein [Acidimicrobiales bacterium]
MSDASDTTMPAVDGVCEECGFDYDGLTDAEVPERLRDLGRRYRTPLSRGLKGEDLDALVRAHPTPGVWSALEYACHVRDVLQVQRERLELALAEDVPSYTPMGREERVVDDRYNEQAPLAVADQLAANGEALADWFAVLDADQWARRALYGYPEPTERDMRWLGRHTVHEGHHHLLDVGRVLRAARGR